MALDQMILETFFFFNEFSGLKEQLFIISHKSKGQLSGFAEQG